MDVADVKDAALSARFALHAKILANVLRIAHLDRMSAIRARDIPAANPPSLLRPRHRRHLDAVEAKRVSLRIVRISGN
jgi:hypothetical protein